MSENFIAPNVTALDIANAKMDYENLKKTYQRLFCAMYKFEDSYAYWTGHVLSVADYFFGLYDIMYAVDNQINEDILFEWYDYDMTLCNYYLGSVSLENYSKGILEYSKEDVKLLNELQGEFTKAKLAIDDLLANMKKGKTEQQLI